MFTIDKILISGDIPDMCFMCPLAAFRKVDRVGVCSVKYQTRRDNNNHKYHINPTDAPPPWCPLEKSEER
jgi:hypothetical protein